MGQADVHEPKPLPADATGGDTVEDRLIEAEVRDVISAEIALAEDELGISVTGGEAVAFGEKSVFFLTAKVRGCDIKAFLLHWGSTRKDNQPEVDYTSSGL